MKFEFTKMHGLGNDFMIICWPDDMAMPREELVRTWANRRTGIGFDQLLILQKSAKAEADIFYRVFNADGSEVEQCGNGARCIAHYLFSEIEEKALVLESMAGLVEARLLADGILGINLGEPNFVPSSLPSDLEATSELYRLDLTSGIAEFGLVSMGNPHAVIKVNSVEQAPVRIVGPELQSHSSYPQGVNVGFVQFLDEKSLKLRVFERGVGETKACGTGAAAAVALGRWWGLLEESVKVELKGGILQVEWQGPGYPLWLSGTATKVIEGHIEYEPTKKN